MKDWTNLPLWVAPALAGGVKTDFSSHRQTGQPTSDAQTLVSTPMPPQHAHRLKPMPPRWGITVCLVSTELMRSRLFFAVCSLAAAQFGPSKVVSARLENITVVPDKASIHVNIRNSGDRPITAFSIDFYVLDAKGERIPCGGRGVDMIDWSDPMPGRNLYIHMRRNWTPPNGTFLIDGYPRCPGVEAPLDSIQVELNNVMFDDGTGEGDSHRMEFTLLARQQVALDITQSAAHSPQPHNSEFIEWRITDLEQRTARLVGGAGKTDVNPN